MKKIVKRDGNVSTTSPPHHPIHLRPRHRSEIAGRRKPDTLLIFNQGLIRKKSEGIGGAMSFQLLCLGSLVFLYQESLEFIDLRHIIPPVPEGKIAGEGRECRGNRRRVKKEYRLPPGFAPAP
jgi:hypothetical protein